MVKAVINAGNCGYTTTVNATPDGKQGVELEIESGCKAIRRLAEHLTEVQPFNEISFRGSLPATLRLGQEYCSHAACPVPVGIIKAIEVAAGLALPGEASIVVTKEDA